MNSLSREDFIHEQLKSKSGDNYSLSSVLSERLQSDDFFIHHEIIEPTYCSSAPHRHTGTDKIVIVLKGNVVAYEGCKKKRLSEGGYSLFF